MSVLATTSIVKRISDPEIELWVKIDLVPPSNLESQPDFSDSNGMRILCKAKQLPWAVWQASIVSSVVYVLRKALRSGRIDSYGDYMVVIQDTSGITDFETDEDGIVLAVTEGIGKLLGVEFRAQSSSDWKIRNDR